MAVRFYRNNLKYRTSPESSNWTGLMLHTDAENGDVSYARSQILTSEQQLRARQNIGLDVVSAASVYDGTQQKTQDVINTEVVGLKEREIAFTKFKALTASDVTLGTGLTISNGSLSYAVSENGKWLKLYGWERYQTSNNAGTHIMTIHNVPITPPEQEFDVTGVGFGYFHTAVDSSTVTNSWTKMYFNCPYLKFKPNGDIELYHMGHNNGHQAAYFTFYLVACIIQVADFGDDSSGDIA